MPRTKKPCGRKAGHPGQHMPTSGSGNTDAGRKRARQLRAWWREVIDAYKTSRGCENCGFQNQRGGYFDLDHVDRSSEHAGTGISTLVRQLNPKLEDHVERVLVELRKCQVLCVACHREKTAADLASDWGY